MNGSSSPSPELPLPMPTPEQGVGSTEALVGIESKSGAVDGVSQGPTSTMPVIDPSQFATATQASTATVNDNQEDKTEADDADVIEKEWVTKAKLIVDSTRNNPNQQSSELSKFKAEYLKKRFNKEVRTVKETLESS